MGSFKKYQWLAMSVKNILEKGEQRTLSDSLAILADTSSGVGYEEQLQELSPAVVDALAEGLHSARSSNAGHSLPLAVQSRSPLAARSHSHSRSPRAPRSPAAIAASSVELGAQTLVDVVRARLRQGLRAWVTHARQHRLQDLHSSVLRALQTATNVQIAAPVQHLDPVHHGSGELARAETKAASLTEHENQAHDRHHPGDNSVQGGSQNLSSPSLSTPSRAKVQPGASFAGLKYCGDSMRLRSKERHVRAKERSFGTAHPEVESALLALAGHHGQRGNVEAQRMAMERATAAQQNHLHGGHHNGAGTSTANASSLMSESQEVEHSHRHSRPADFAVQPHPAVSAAHGHQSQEISAITGLLERPSQLAHHGREASPDKLVSQLYSDQARVDEVIKLANKLLESGVLAVGPRKPPILKASLLLRLAERMHNAAMRDTVQHWWRNCTLQRTMDQMGISGSHSLDHPTEKVGHMGHGSAEHGSGVWQDAHHSSLGKDVDDHGECQRLRNELKAMEEKVAEYAAKVSAQAPHHDVSMQSHVSATSAANDALAQENAALREQLQAMQSSKGLVVEQPLAAPGSRRNSHQSGLGGASSSRSQQQQVQHNSNALSDQLPSKQGTLVCRILAAHQLRHRENPQGMSDPFVLARVGSVQFQTQTMHDTTSPTWSSERLEFPLNLRRAHDRILFLKVLDHGSFHLGQSLGELEVKVSALTPGQTYNKREQLHNGNGAEIEFEVCFLPSLEADAGHTEHEDDVESMDGHPLPTPHGLLSCRVIAAHNIHDPGQNEASEPFVVARLGRHDFRTSSATSSSNPVWQANPFLFRPVNISHVRDQNLHLNVYTHKLFHESQCIGSAEVHLKNLKADTRLKMRELLHGGEGGELEFEVCFMPEGEPAASETGSFSPASAVGNALINFRGASSKPPSSAGQDLHGLRSPRQEMPSLQSRGSNPEAPVPQSPYSDSKHEVPVDDLLASLGESPSPSHASASPLQKAEEMPGDLPRASLTAAHSGDLPRGSLQSTNSAAEVITQDPAVGMSQMPSVAATDYTATSYQAESSNGDISDDPEMSDEELAGLFPGT